MEFSCQVSNLTSVNNQHDAIEHTFILYGYSSRGDDTPPDRLTSSRHRRSVCSWLKTGSRASETGSEDMIRL